MANTFLYRQQCPSGSVPYIIRSGDTLYGIASDYNSTVQAIITANPGINPERLLVGQQICVPLSIQMYPSCPTTNYYIVRPGDTFDSISNYFNVTTTQLLYSNYGIDPNSLYVDQILCIPVAPSPVTIEVTVADRKLAVYQSGTEFRTYPMAAESPASQIPRGNFTVLNKQVDPGVEIGARWLGLSKAGFGIRGTNSPGFINVVSTGQSIILSNQDVSELFNLAPVGTAVSII